MRRRTRTLYVVQLRPLPPRLIAAGNALMALLDERDREDPPSYKRGMTKGKDNCIVLYPRKKRKERRAKG